MLAQLATALGFGIGLPGAVGVLGLAVGIVKDGSPLRRSFWTAS